MLCEKVKKSVTPLQLHIQKATIEIESPTVAQIYRLGSPTALCEGPKKQVRSSIGIGSSTSSQSALLAWVPKTWDSMTSSPPLASFWTSPDERFSIRFKDGINLIKKFV